MPDRRRHRGPHPSDAKLFGDAWIPTLRVAVHDYSWLLTRGYADRSALKVVGDRYQLRQRQRLAVMRCSCSDAAREDRSSRLLEPQALHGRSLLVDGYNVLTTVEAALSGGLLLVGRDACLRDMASMHGSYRKVDETAQAIGCIGAMLESLGVGPVTWYLDAPVSNSGRLAGVMSDIAAAHDWPWSIELVHSPDHVLATAPDTMATADSVVLDAGGPWFNLARAVVAHHAPDAWILDLGGAS